MAANYGSRNHRRPSTRLHITTFQHNMPNISLKARCLFINIQSPLGYWWHVGLSLMTTARRRSTTMFTCVTYTV